MIGFATSAIPVLWQQESLFCSSGNIWVIALFLMSSRARAKLVWSTRQPILLHSIALSIPLATAWPERAFSTLYHVKTKQQNRLLDVTLNALINVSMNSPDKTVTRKSSIGGFTFVQGGWTFWKLTKSKLIYSVSSLNLRSLGDLMKARLRFVNEMDKSKEQTESDRASTKNGDRASTNLQVTSKKPMLLLMNKSCLIKLKLQNLCWN